MKGKIRVYCRSRPLSKSELDRVRIFVYTRYYRIVLSYHNTPYLHTCIPYSTFPNHTVPYHAVPYPTMPYHIIPYHIALHHTKTYQTIVNLTIHTNNHAISSHSTPYNTIPYHIRYITSYQNTVHHYILYHSNESFFIIVYYRVIIRSSNHQTSTVSRLKLEEVRKNFSLIRYLRKRAHKKKCLRTPM